MALTLLLAGGRRRALLVAAVTAAVSGVAMVAASILRMGLGGSGAESAIDPRLWPVVGEPGTRGGAAAAALLLAVPLLLLLDQAVRLGSGARERRWAALAVAGATRADRRRWGVVEVGVPAAAGGVLGVVVWLLLRLLLGTALAPRGWAVVPLDTGPGVWAPVVVVAVAVAGALVGWRQGGREAATLPGAAPRRRPPRWWPLLVTLAGLALAVLALSGDGAGLPALLAVLLVVGGLVGSGPWLTWTAARVVGPRVTSPAVLLAVRRLEADPRPAGRVAAAVAGLALVGGFLGPRVADVLGRDNSGDTGYYLGSLGLVAALVAAGTVLVSTTAALHSAETLLQRRRQVAALSATGVPASVVASSQRAEVLLATVPAALVGSVLTGLGSSALRTASMWAGLLGVLVTVLVVVLAGLATSAAGRRWIDDAARPEHLRTG